MSGWAATNTLREALDELREARAIAHRRMSAAAYASRPSLLKERQSDEADDALALVEAALDAAQPMANLPYPLSADERQQWLTRQGALAAALRAVREGK